MGVVRGMLSHNGAVSILRHQQAQQVFACSEDCVGFDLGRGRLLAVIRSQRLVRRLNGRGCCIRGGCQRGQRGCKRHNGGFLILHWVIPPLL